jgi:hypothetical protein
MSWAMARVSVMTKIFSWVRVLVAGNWFGILMGMIESLRGVITDNTIL